MRLRKLGRARDIGNGPLFLILQWGGFENPPSSTSKSLRKIPQIFLSLNEQLAL